MMQRIGIFCASNTAVVIDLSCQPFSKHIVALPASVEGASQAAIAVHRVLRQRQTTGDATASFSKTSQLRVIDQLARLKAIPLASHVWHKQATVHGASRTRTGDLLGAIQALFQLSYSPEIRDLQGVNPGYRW
jgi:hypothetical protein